MKKKDIYLSLSLAISCISSYFHLQERHTRSFDKELLKLKPLKFQQGKMLGYAFLMFAMLA